MTPTAQAIADIVLPASTFPEKDSVFTIGVPLNAIQKVAQVGECKSDWEINFELAKRLNPEAVPWKNVKEMFTERLKPSGLTFEELCQKVWILAPKNHPSGSVPYRRYEKGQLRSDGKAGFRTPTGKIELYCTRYKEYGLDPLPYFEEPPESPLRTPDIWKDYPFILIGGRRSPISFHSEHRQVPWLREIEPDPWMEIHPDAAKPLGIEPGDWVWIEGRLGRCKRKAKLTRGIHPRMVFAPSGWWYPEKDSKAPYFSGIWELNINQLVPMGCQSKSGFGGVPIRTMLCKVYRV
jgi:anaerobic selenocysteine-containing dehydrogenase